MITKILNIQTNKKYEAVKANYTNEDIITLFTPTYNRAKFLPRLYDMLLNQTSKDFVWIIVNDGSTDNTDYVISNLLETRDIPILYIKKANGGKHSAFKVALDRCFTNYFQCMDDDDIYSTQSVETYLRLWDEVNSQFNHDIGAIRTLSRRKNGEAVVSGVEDIVRRKPEDVTTLDMNYMYCIIQENWTCYKTSALREINLFDDNYWLSEQHTFFSEAIWQGRFARKYKCRYVYIFLREYTDDAETSIIRANKSKQHYVNMFINAKILLEEQFDYISRSKALILKNILLVQLLRGVVGIKNSALVSNTSLPILKKLYILSAPISLFGKVVLSLRNRQHNI